MTALPLNRQSAVYKTRMIIGVILLALLAPIAIMGADRALQTMYNAPAYWLPDSLPVRQDYEDFARRFQGQDTLLIGWEGSDLGSPDIDKAMDALGTFAEAGNDRPAYFSKVTSGQEIYDLLNSPPTSFSDRSTRARLREALVGNDGKQTVLLATFNEEGSRNRIEAMNQIRVAVAEAVETNPGDVRLAGPPADGALVDLEAQRSVGRFTLPSCLVGGLICVFCLRSWLLSTAVLTVAIVGQGMALAAVAISGLDMNAILIVLPPLVFVLTASAGIHLCNYYLDAVKHDPRIDPTAAARQAIQAGSLPCWLAATTTIIGLGSLGLVRLWPVSAFGWIAASSVFGTLLLLMLVLPGTMQWHGRRFLAQQKLGNVAEVPAWRIQINQLWKNFAGSMLRHPIPVVLLFTVVTAICAAGLPKLTTSVNIPRMFPPQSRIRADYQWFEEHLGPTINAEVVVEFGDGSMEDVIDQFRFIRVLDNKLRELEDVGGVVSARTFLPSPPSKERRTIGATVLETNIRKQIEGTQSALQKSGYLAIGDNDERLWRISLRFPFSEDIDYREKLESVRTAFGPLFEKLTEKTGLTGDVANIRAIYTGGVPMTTKSQDVLLKDLFRSFLAAFGIVALIMMLLLRNIAGGLLAMFPNLFPTITLFGAMGLAQTPLDIGSVMTASVALGIAVDGTIHLLSRFRRQLRDGATRLEASTRALDQCGPAMWQTTAVCALSPLVYGLSDFVPTQRFAYMMFGLLLAALIGDVLLLPALLASPLGRWLAPKKAKGVAGGNPDPDAVSGL